MVASSDSPLYGQSPCEVPLLQAPLIRVLAQIKFPTILSIGSDENEVAAFQEKIRSVYPILERDQSFALVTGSSSTSPEIRPGVIWKFRDLQNHWQVVLTPDFVALEAFKYSSRADFLERLEKILAAVQSTYAPSAALRVGMRYVDCIKPPHIERIEDLFQVALLGIHTTALGLATDVNMTECLLRAQEGNIQCRWGLLPDGATHDPGIALPAGGKSWVLDLDMFSSEQMPFDSADLSEVARSYASRLYAVFRWMIKEEFLRTFGATP